MNAWICRICYDILVANGGRLPRRTNYNTYIRHIVSGGHAKKITDPWEKNMRAVRTLDDENGNRYVIAGMPCREDYSKKLEIAQWIRSEYGILIDILFIGEFCLCTAVVESSGLDQQNRFLSVTAYDGKPVRVYRKSEMTDDDWIAVFSRKVVQIAVQDRRIDQAIVENAVQDPEDGDVSDVEDTAEATETDCCNVSDEEDAAEATETDCCNVSDEEDAAEATETDCCNLNDVEDTAEATETDCCNVTCCVVS